MDVHNNADIQRLAFSKLGILKHILEIKFQDTQNWEAVSQENSQNDDLFKTKF